LPITSSYIVNNIIGTLGIVRFRTADGPDKLPESTGLIKELFMTGNFLVTVSARVFVYRHFACE